VLQEAPIASAPASRQVRRGTAPAAPAPDRRRRRLDTYQATRSTADEDAAAAATAIEPRATGAMGEGERGS